MEIRDLAHRLGEYKICFSTEHDLQDGIEAALVLLATNHKFAFEREYRLSPADRPDFFLPKEGIAIECKIKGSSSDAIRQLHRYAKHEAVTGVILFTSRMRHAAPIILNGKPIHTVVHRAL